MKVRELVNIVSSCEPRRILSKISSEGPALEGPGKDSGLPIVGECTLSAYPVYFGKVNSSDEYRVTVADKAIGAMKDMLPNGVHRLSKWYCLSEDLSGYKSIPADKLPMITRKAGYLGDFEVRIDPTMPGANNELQYDTDRIFGDMVLRFDLKKTVYDEAVAKGCRYLIGSPSLAEDMPHVAILTRADIAIEYDFRTHTWGDVENLAPISSLNNKTQHRDFVAICQPGQFNLSGEEVAKMVLTVEDAIKKLGQKYEANLDEILTPTRFKVMHPLDTKGYFLRMSASTIATSSAKPLFVPSRSHFPIWLHDTRDDSYYEVALGFALTPITDLPESRAVAGTLNSRYEVIYDTEANDMYDTQQLAYLVGLFAKSPYVRKEGDGVVAMYGCMEHLNSVFAPILLGQGAMALPEIKGTRIEDLSPSEDCNNIFNAFFGLSTSCARTLTYSNTDDEVHQVNIAMYDRDKVLSGECVSYPVKALLVAKALVRFAEADPFAVWEAGLQSRMELELVEPPVAFSDYFSKAPHVYDPPRVSARSWLYLKTDEGKVYVPDDKFNWCEYVDDVPANETIEVGKFFCGTLYASNQEVFVGSENLSALLLSTAQYFVSFDRAPTVYKYFYNLDAKSHRWEATAAVMGENNVILGNDKGAICFNMESHLWSYNPASYKDGVQYGPFYCSTPECTLTVDMLQTACRSLSACAASLVAQEQPCVDEVPAAFSRDRCVPAATDTYQWSVQFNGNDYTLLDQDWALCTDGPRLDCKGAVVEPADFASLLASYACYFLKLQSTQVQVYQVFHNLLGGVFDSIIKDEPAYTISGHMWCCQQCMEFGANNGLVQKPSNLQSKDVSSDNIMQVSIDLVSSIGAFTVTDVADTILQLNKVDALFYNVKAENWQASQQSFMNRQGALADKLERSIRPGGKSALISVGQYMWDGVDWYQLEDIGADWCQVGTVFGMAVCYNRQFTYTPITERATEILLYNILALLWEPSPAAFQLMETSRRM